MNIFFLHMNPRKCAKYHVDKHVVKMILETVQLLCSAHYFFPKMYLPKYKLTHKNHPCSIWTRESLSNYMWLLELGKELCKEYTYRYEKTHKCEPMFDELSTHLPNIKDIGFTNPALAMPDEFKRDNAVESYRLYYNSNKKHLFNWKNRKVPKFIKN